MILARLSRGDLIQSNALNSSDIKQDFALIIFRYLGREVYAPMLATTAILLIVFICNQFIHYLGDTAAGHLTIKALIQLMMLQIPLLLGFMLPLGLFLGILLAYGRLHVDNEMTILSACGVSRGAIIWMTLGFASMVMVVVALLIFWVEPQMAWYRDHVLAQASAASPVEKIFPGRFDTIDNGRLVLYTEKLSRDHRKMQNVFVALRPLDAVSDQQKPWNIVVANSAEQKNAAKTNDAYVVFHDGYRYIGAPGQKKFQMIKYQEYGVRIPQRKFSLGKEAEFTPTLQLWHEQFKNKLAAAELQWRFSLPISVMILTLLAVPLSTVKPRQGRYRQLVPAIIIYIIYADLLFVAEAWVQKGTVAIGIGMWWVHILMFLFAMVLISFYLGWLKPLDFQRSLWRAKS